MKKKVWIASGIAGIVLLGGAVGAGAIANPIMNEKLIPIEEAKDISLKEVNGTVESIELEEEHGRLVYDVDVYSKDNNDDVEVDVDAETGAVVKVDDVRNDDSQNTVTDSTQQSRNIITKEEAIAIATADTPGKAVEVDFDGDDGDYEIEIRDGNLKAEYKIDAYTGNILEKESEDDDWDDED
ncbi:MAG TPA: PepSY domain-containing protein [Bacillus sp. (in: firmicutes)]|uniref:PepSY domain-containing protein n=1 Tax=Bacillus litorisediminis TaxID=2922713 RepID=UPI001FAE6355|nr:PepSY domain-containing protein [Bacillus litorisediminis]HWO74475.1 PepSY domain-containing protein [Bacillus sp. (in: firmicutes)]